MQVNLNITKKDDDEDGRKVKSAESWRLMRANDGAFLRPITSESEDRKQQISLQVDSFRIAA